VILTTNSLFYFVPQFTRRLRFYFPLRDQRQQRYPSVSLNNNFSRFTHPRKSARERCYGRCDRRLHLRHLISSYHDCQPLPSTSPLTRLFLFLSIRQPITTLHHPASAAYSRTRRLQQQPQLCDVVTRACICIGFRVNFYSSACGSRNRPRVGHWRSLTLPLPASILIARCCHRPCLCR
jgi:hypothetical protein